MDKVELERRTKDFALNIVQFVTSLPKNKVADALGYQVLKSGTSVGANYREANRAESHDDFIHKIGIVEKEASESEYWLELLEKSHIGDAEDIGKLLRECRELIAIFTAIGKTAKARRIRSRQAKNSQLEIRNPK
jgi:four helix bundle protein